MRVCGCAHALAPGSHAPWLADQLAACGVAGALSEPGLRAPSLLAFSRQVSEGAQGSAHDLELERWSGEPVEHVHVLQRSLEVVLGDPLAAAGRRPRSGCAAGSSPCLRRARRSAGRVGERAAARGRLQHGRR